MLSKYDFNFILQLCISPSNNFDDVIWATVAERDEVNLLVSHLKRKSLIAFELE